MSGIGIGLLALGTLAFIVGGVGVGIAIAAAWTVIPAWALGAIVCGMCVALLGFMTFCIGEMW